MVLSVAVAAFTSTLSAVIFRSLPALTCEPDTSSLPPALTVRLPPAFKFEPFTSCVILTVSVVVSPVNQLPRVFVRGSLLFEQQFFLRDITTRNQRGIALGRQIGTNRSDAALSRS